MSLISSDRAQTTIQQIRGTTTPLKINMEHIHGGLVQISFLSEWVISRFQHVNLPGCVSPNKFPSLQKENSQTEFHTLYQLLPSRDLVITQTEVT